MVTGLKNPKYIEAKKFYEMKNVKNFYERRNKIIEGFKNNIFPVYYDGTQVVTSESDEERNSTGMPNLESEKSAADRNITILQKQN